MWELAAVYLLTGSCVYSDTTDIESQHAMHGANSINCHHNQLIYTDVTHDHQHIAFSSVWF